MLELSCVEARQIARVEGQRGSWRVDPAQLDRDFEGRCALLSPLDRLIVDRKRMADLFDFDYQLEMYKPVTKRRWGYWAPPILYGHELVGKVYATADRAARILRAQAVHQDGTWSKDVTRAVHEEVESLAAWLQLKVVRWSS